MDERQYYPLSKEQQGLVLLAGALPVPNFLYLLTKINFESEIDEARMLKAIRLTGERLPYCRVRLHQMEDGSDMQYLSEDAPDPAQVIDLRETTSEELDRLMVEWRKEPFPNDMRDVQLYRFRLLRLPDGKYALHFLVHHFIMDAYAMSFTINYLDQVYSALTKGSELPAPAPLPWKLFDEENAYFSSAKKQRDEDWWHAQFETEPQFCSINGLGGPEFVEGKRYGRKQEFRQLFTEGLYLRIPAELVDRVNAEAARQRVSPQVFYLLALRSYLARVNRSEDVNVVTPVALRSTLYRKASGMSIAKNVTVRSVFPETISFEEAAQRLAGIENEIYRHAQYENYDIRAYVDGKYGVPNGCSYESVWLTYQPYFRIDKTELRFSAEFLTNGFVPIPLYMLVQPQDDSGDLYGIYFYAIGYTKKESCENFHAFMLNFLEKAVAAPGKSLESLVTESMP